MFGIGTTVVSGIALDVVDAVDSDELESIRLELDWWCARIRDGAGDLGLL